MAEQALTSAGTGAKPLVNLLIVDLDNTLWDWVAVWVESFDSLLSRLHDETKIPLDVLKSEARSVHQQRGTTEYSLLLDEMPALQPHLNGKRATERFEAALHQQNSIRAHNTRLYPTVLPALLQLKTAGVRIVAYTESIQYWTEWRIRRLGLDGVLDEYYSAPDHDFPHGITPQDIRTQPSDAYGLKVTTHRATPKHVFKPDATVLQQIVADNGAGVTGIAYVGDSLMKDVQMAQALGVYDVHAAYGVAQDKPGYELLRELSHWSQEDIERERLITAGGKVTPTYVLQNNFGELLNLFEFGPRPDADTHLKLWEKSVDVQQHFNDIGWRIRALGLTALTFALGASGFVYVNVDLKGVGRLAWAAPILGLLLWAAFWFMDAMWFHRLLKGAVADGARLERLLNSIGVRADLGRQISAASPLRKPRLHSTGKLHLFYVAVSVGLLVVSVALAASSVPAITAQPQSGPSSAQASQAASLAPSASNHSKRTNSTPTPRRS